MSNQEDLRQLKLIKLTEDIGKLVDEGVIGLSNAFQLAKLNQNDQKRICGSCHFHAISTISYNC